MDKTITDIEMVRKVLRFYARKSTYEPEFGTIPIWQDKGLRARMTLDALDNNRAKDSIWLTEEMANLQRYNFREVDNGWIIIHTSYSGKTFSYAGYDLNFHTVKEFAELVPFPSKYLALLALAKRFEKQNKKGKF